MKQILKFQVTQTLSISRAETQTFLLSSQAEDSPKDTVCPCSWFTQHALPLYLECPVHHYFLRLTPPPLSHPAPFLAQLRIIISSLLPSAHASDTSLHCSELLLTSRLSAKGLFKGQDSDLLSQ